MSVRPPDVQSTYDECDLYTQAKIIAYGMIRDLEDFELSAKLAGAEIK